MAVGRQFGQALFENVNIVLLGKGNNCRRFCVPVEIGDYPVAIGRVIVLQNDERKAVRDAHEAGKIVYPPRMGGLKFP